MARTPADTNSSAAGDAGACRVLHPKSRAATPERQAEVLRAVASERLSLRAAARVFGLGRNTITGWLEKKDARLPPLSETLLPAEKGDGLALNELWSFVGSKANPRWMWSALCRQTRQVVASFIGDRSVDGVRVPCAQPPTRLSPLRHA